MKGVIIRFLRAHTGVARGWVTVLGATGAIAVAYFLTARLGLALRLAGSDVAVFWPASGVAAGILIVSGRRALAALVIGVVVGTVVAGLVSDRSPPTSLINGIWNAGEAVLAAWLLEQWFGQPFTFSNLGRIAGFVAAAGLASAASAIGGAATLVLLHTSTTAPYWDVWREWFLSALVGMVVIVPLVIAAAQVWRERPPRREWIEGVGVLGLTAVACSYTMTQATGSWLSFSPSSFVLPLLLWLVARCKPTFAIAGAFFASTAIILATTFGIGRFGDTAVPIMQRVAGAQLAMMTVTLFTLVLAVLFTQRKAAEDRLAKKRAMLARLHEVGSRLWLKRDLRQALDEILAGAIELMGADMGAIRLFDTTRGTLKIEAQRGFTPEFLDCFGKVPVVAEDGSPCCTVLQSSRRMVIEDVEADAAFTPFRPLARAAGYRAIQSTPIMNGEDMPLGTLATYFRSVHKPDERDLHLLEHYVQQAADIIERHKAEDALRKSEERLRLAQMQTGIGVWDWDLRADTATRTPELEAVFGLKPGGVKCYADFRKRVHPDDIDGLEARRADAVQRREPYKIDYRIIRPDGQVRWISTVGGAFYDEATGEPTRMIGNSADITERKLAELALAERNLQLEVAGKVGLVGSYVYDSQTERIQISPGYAAIYDLPNGTTEIPFGEWLAHVHPEDVATLQALRSETFRERRGEYKVDFRIIRRDSETRWIESRGSILYGSDVGTRRVIGVNIDVTERKRTELALAEREAQLAMAAKGARVGCYANNLQTGVITVSEGYAAIHGLPEGTLQTTLSQWRTRVHPDDLAPFDELRERIFGNRQRDFTYDYRIIHADQRVRWIESRGSVSYDEHGEPQHCVGINIDVTERKQTEARLSDALAAGHVVAFEWDAATGRSQRSDNGARILGVVQDSHFLEQVHPDDRAGLKRHIRALSAESPSYALAFRFVRADGCQIWLEEMAKGEFDGAGRLLRIKGLTRDITERKLAELALAERNAQLTLAGKAGRVGHFAYDLDTGLITGSEGYAAIYGLPEGTTQTTVDQWRASVHPDDLPQFDELRRQMFQHRSHDFSFNYRIIRADGQIRWINSRRFVCYDAEGQPRRMVGINIDITERKELEDHKNTLISELDHRVKNVLAIVSTVASRTQETSSSMAEFVAALDGRIKSMATTHELLSHRRWQGIPLAELVRHELAPYATVSNTRIDGPDVVLSAEAGQSLAMVFHELATNAAKFGAISAKAGRVTVRWSLVRTGQGESWLNIEWEESGGPRVVSPTRSGFGTSVVREMVPYELGGTVDLAHLPEGVRCSLQIPARWLSADDGRGAGGVRGWTHGRLCHDV